MGEADDPTQSSITQHVEPICADARNLAKWIEWIVMDDLPFSFVEHLRTHRFANLIPVSRPTLMKYLKVVVDKLKDVCYHPHSESFLTVVP